MKKESYKLHEIADYYTNKILTNEIGVENYISTTNMLQNRKGIMISESLPPSVKINKYEEGDILISNIRPYFKKIWFADKVGGCDADILNIRARNEFVINEYLYYVLFNEEFFDYVMIGAKGVKMPRGDKKFIMDYDIELPDKRVQQEVIDKVSPLFKLIDSNEYLIKKLNYYSQLLYHKWFVEYNFPNLDGLPYKESGGEFKEVHGKLIPIDWDVSTVGKECTVIMGQSPPSETYNEEGVGLPFYQGVVDYGFRFPTVSKWCSIPARIASIGDVLLSVRAPVGRLNVAIEECCIGRGVSAVRLEGTNNYFAYYELERGMARLKKQGNGTVFDAIKKDDILRQKFLVPSDGLVERFEEEVGAYQEKILNATKENKLLEETRDLLIKKLIK